MEVDVTADVFDSSRNLIGSGTIYLDGVKVGDAAQTTSRVNLMVRLQTYLSLI